MNRGPLIALIVLLMALSITGWALYAHRSAEADRQQTIEVTTSTPADTVGWQIVYGTAIVDTVDVMASLEVNVEMNMAIFDSLLVLEGARPFPKNSDYIERAIYDQCADILLTTTRVLERATFRSPENRRAVAALAMREWQPRYMLFRHFRTDYGASGHDEGRDWMALCQMGYQYIAVLEPAFEVANSLATHIDAGSE